ncbi:LOW QUALITY PROTEIN: hypothetical protein TorRG33x02_353300, partial [Trema orientale]
QVEKAPSFPRGAQSIGKTLEKAWRRPLEDLHLHGVCPEEVLSREEQGEEEVGEPEIERGVWPETEVPDEVEHGAGEDAHGGDPREESQPPAARRRGNWERRRFGLVKPRTIMPRWRVW